MNHSPREITVYHWHRIIPAVALLLTTVIAVAWLARHLLGSVDEAFIVADVPTDLETVTTASIDAIQSAENVESDGAPGASAAIFLDELEVPAAGTPVAGFTPGSPASSIEDDELFLNDAPQSSVKSKITLAKAESAAEIRRKSTAEDLRSGTAVVAEEVDITENSVLAVIDRVLIEFAEQQAYQAPDQPIEIYTDHLTRAQLTSALNEYEPIDEFGSVIKMNEKGILRVFFFTEMQGLKGDIIHHDWYLEDKRVARVEIKPYRSPTRASSSKFIDKHMLGKWTVKVVSNKKNSLLAEAEFEVK